MIWLTWRQSRMESLIGGAVLALVAAYLLWTGLEMVSSYNDAGLPRCVAEPAADEGCLATAGDFRERFDDLRGITMVLWICLPFLLGLLLAAPAVLEFEQGTYRLAWTQSVTRRRWLASKVLFGLAVATGASAALVALWTWWRGPLDAIEGRFNGNSFDFEGTVPIAYTVFAFALCLAVGTILRRAIAAAAIGLVLFLTARAVVTDQLRPRFLSPEKLVWSPNDPAPTVVPGGLLGNGDWVLSQSYTDSAGQSLPRGEPTVRGCIMEAEDKSGPLFEGCLRDHGILNTIVYHPGDRFWVLQGIETALFLGLTAGLLALTAWWVTRRIA